MVNAIAAIAAKMNGMERQAMAAVITLLVEGSTAAAGAIIVSCALIRKAKAMSYTIRLLPGGHEFQAEAHETLLDAALRCGVNVHYNCNSGTCGGCGVRVVSGRVEEERFHDYVMKEPEKRQGHVLLCSVTAASDMVIESIATASADEIPRQSIDAKVMKVESIGDDYRVLHLRTPRTHTLRFLAGQQVALQVADLPPRRLFIASCPCNGMVLQFHLRRDAADAFAVHVFNHMAIHDPVRIDGPVGDFILDDDSVRPLVMVAQETGFAPIKSLIEHAIALELPQPQRLFWVAPAPDGHYLENYCRALKDSLDDFDFTLLLARHDGEWPRLAAAMAAAASTPAACDVYVCAAPTLAEAVRQAFIQRGACAGRIKLASGAMTGVC